MTETFAQKISHEELVFLKIQDRSPLYLPQLKSFDAVIIEYSNQLATEEIVKKIRCHNMESVYLIPIFVYKIYEEETGTRNPLIDGTIHSISNLAQVAEITRKIKNKLMV
jgi:hypothetical protein